MKKLFISLSSLLFFFMATAQPKDTLKLKKNIPAGFVQAFHFKVHMSDMMFDTYVSNAGVIAKQFAGNAEGIPKRGVFIRYADDSLFKIDYIHSVYYGSTLQEADSLLNAERAMAEKSTISFGSTVKLDNYIPRQITKLNTVRKFNHLPVSLKSYVSPTNKTWTLYYTKVSDLTPAILPRKSKQPVGSNDLQALLMPDADHILIHAEVMVNGKNEVVLDLDESNEINIPASTFAVPTKFMAAKLNVPIRLKMNKIPQGPGFKMTQPHSDVNAFREVTIDHGIGPVIGHPSLYVIYWGKQLNVDSSGGAIQTLATSMLDIVSKKYTGALSFYGVNEGKIVRNIYVNDDPPSSAGGAVSGAVVSNFVIDQIFDKQLPKIWWSFGDEDPLYMVIVNTDQVDYNGWCGYHFVIPTFYDSFVPFPFNYLMHEELPYAFAEVPNKAMKLGLEDLIQRDNLCTDIHSPACQVIRSYDIGTADISHEYTEVCTDPTPFFSWVDAGRGVNGEIADICEGSGDCRTSYPTPGSFSKVNSTIVSTYWSVPANQCVPSTQTSISIQEPADQSEVSWQTGGAQPTLFALASNSIDGDIENIHWTDEMNRALGTGVNITSQPLSLGAHTITATAFNSAMVPLASAVTHINVSAREPVPTITSPNSSQSYAADDLINFRGSAMDPQDGDLSDNQLTWSINGTVIGNGKLLSAKINKTGIVGVTLTATNSAGVQSSSAVLVKLTAANNNSSIKIVEPITETTFFNPDDIITFKAVALQSNGQPVSENEIIWRDDLDGFLGTGSTITHKLSGGPGGPIIHHVSVSILILNGKPTPKDSIVVKKGAIL